MLGLLGLSRHDYYYRPEKGRKGRRPSTHTPRLHEAGPPGLVTNEEVVAEIIGIKLGPETDYGYKAMTAALMLLGYVINRKKVYRLMRQWQLLHERRERPPRRYARYRRVAPEGPLRVIEMDMKFQWVTSHQRYAYILTVIDCFTRKVLHWQVAYSIRHGQVRSAWEQIIVNYLQPNDMLGKDLTVEVRNDNDGRFAAHTVQLFMAENHLTQVFTHPYTPEENGHVESFHAILGRSLGRQTFLTVIDLEKYLGNFYEVYNKVRLHGSLDHLPPDLFWNLWKDGLIGSVLQKNRTLRHRLKVPHYQLSGNGSLRAASGLPVGQKMRQQAI